MSAARKSLPASVAEQCIIISSIFRILIFIVFRPFAAFLFSSNIICQLKPKNALNAKFGKNNCLLCRKTAGVSHQPRLRCFDGGLSAPVSPSFAFFVLLLRFLVRVANTVANCNRRFAVRHLRVHAGANGIENNFQRRKAEKFADGG